MRDACRRHPGSIGRFLSPHDQGAAKPHFHRHHRDHGWRHTTHLRHCRIGVWAVYHALRRLRCERAITPTTPPPATSRRDPLPQRPGRAAEQALNDGHLGASRLLPKRTLVRRIGPGHFPSAKAIQGHRLEAAQEMAIACLGEAFRANRRDHRIAGVSMRGHQRGAINRLLAEDVGPGLPP
jgi:hypothetical protein